MTRSEHLTDIKCYLMEFTLVSTKLQAYEDIKFNTEKFVEQATQWRTDLKKPPESMTKRWSEYEVDRREPFNNIMAMVKMLTIIK